MRPAPVVPVVPKRHGDHCAFVCPTSKDSSRWCDSVNTSSQRLVFFICDSSQVCVIFVASFFVLFSSFC